MFKNYFKKSHEKTAKAFNTKTDSAANIIKPNIHDNFQNAFSKEISQIKDFYQKSTVQLIKYEIAKAFNLRQGQDEVWIVESDKMKNYRNYFQADNICNLMEKLPVSKLVNTVTKNKIVEGGFQRISEQKKPMENMKKTQSHSRK